ncbi:hypothetical protein C2G38_2128325 [Gigaspora rosea]|uniref:Uncharacterized protein n=1 Tax=Gigaspora rosea TaxID=44941 RepID=A0A397TSW6_9GLOM|nr:hypothetical protein C2G38_2128325 [Gigaspora rosea]
MGTDIKLTEKQEQVVITVAIGALLVFMGIMFPPIGLAISAAYGGVGLGLRIVGNFIYNKEMEKAGEICQDAATISWSILGSQFLK